LLESKSESFGGIPYAERQMVAFIPDALYYEWDYPIAALQIIPSYPKFAEKLGHRDILGALMNLGVDRGKIGDIILSENNYYLLCEENIADYFIENLDKIKHTVVKLCRISADSIQQKQNFTEKEGIVSSNRLDAVIACIYKLSRNEALELLRSEKIYVNGKLIQNPSHSCKVDDIISVRGFGRFLYQEEYGTTNKGRIKIRVQIY
jgi:RNA-binding protein YlmH